MIYNFTSETLIIASQLDEKVYKISNINTFINPLGLQNCLLAIDVFSNLIFTAPEFPILLRQFEIPIKNNISTLIFVDQTPHTEIGWMILKYIAYITAIKPWNCLTFLAFSFMDELWVYKTYPSLFTFINCNSWVLGVVVQNCSAILYESRIYQNRIGRLSPFPWLFVLQSCFHVCKL